MIGETTRYLGIAGFALGLMLQGCGTAPHQPPSPQTIAVQPQPSLGSEIVLRAIALVGTPYRWGGNDPSGFDCSGLVHFVHNELGIDVPRTAEEQYRAARRVDIDDLEPGDVLFFKTSGKRVSHVGIYAGAGRFVHAPQSGRLIELRDLNDDYYRPRLAGAGRFFGG
ncbi:MAG TPA: C40 family peptidase [Steroidobacteraceae bacterium]|jgi:murein DD-endopeptidase